MGKVWETRSQWYLGTKSHGTWNLILNEMQSHWVQFFNLLFRSNFRLTEKLQKQYQEFPCTLHSTFPNVHILCNHTIVIKTQKLKVVQYYKLQTVWILPVFPLKSFFCSRICSRIAHCIQLSCLLHLLQTLLVPESFFAFHDFDT